MFFLVTVAADRDNAPAKFMIQLQNVNRWCQVLQAVTMAGCIQFNTLPIGNDDLEDLRQNRLESLKGIASHFIVAADQIQMSQYAIILVLPDKLQNFRIVALIVFLLCPTPLKVLCP